MTALAHRAREAPAGHVAEETCGVLVGSESGAFASATASYLGPEGTSDAGVRTFSAEPSPLVRQAAAFLDAIETRKEARTPPGDALLDIRIAGAVSLSAREGRTVPLAATA